MLARAVTALAAAALLVGGPVTAQQFSAYGVCLEPGCLKEPVTLSRFTLVLMVPIPNEAVLQEPDARRLYEYGVGTLIVDARRAAESHNFMLEVRGPGFGGFLPVPRPDFVPPTYGYLVVAPGRHAVVHEGYLDSPELGRLVESYRAPIKRLRNRTSS